jgi:NAD(P)-dependent dehydrogenase (short-subunit alcohol dehydrogenase family)
MSFQGRAILITGGTSGIGKAAALAFAMEGASVVLAARNDGKGEEAIKEIDRAVALRRQEASQQPTGPGALFVRCDVTSPADCSLAVGRTLETFGRLDVLVNNAGVIVREKSVVDTTPEEWDLTFDVNVKGTYLMSRAAIPAMLGGRGTSEGAPGRGGVIVNNASYLGLVGARGVPAYAASKGAIVNLTRAMALDHAPDGIRVNCIAPGSVDTPMLRKEWEEMGGEEEVRHLFEGKHALGRISQASEVAQAILFLASDKASFITGVCLPVDGGITAA